MRASLGARERERERESSSENFPTISVFIMSEIHSDLLRWINKPRFNSPAEFYLCSIIFVKIRLKIVDKFVC